jgi:hypothetical protein
VTNLSGNDDTVLFFKVQLPPVGFNTYFISSATANGNWKGSEREERERERKGKGRIGKEGRRKGRGGTGALFRSRTFKTLKRRFIIV